MMAQARERRATDIFKLGGKVYAFDSTTIPLCLSVFWWAKLRKKKGGVKAHVLYDLEAQVWYSLCLDQIMIDIAEKV